MIDTAFIQQALLQPEGATLDFKRQMYDLESQQGKKGLILDVLSMANSFRQSSSYILIGIEEGSPNVMVGLDRRYDDAVIQQIVNGSIGGRRLNRNLVFSYYEVVDEATKCSVGVLDIPVQDRPTYAVGKKAYVEKERVYVRRGSSNDVARPEEIALMGQGVVRDHSSPIVDMQVFLGDDLVDGPKVETLRLYRLPEGWISNLPDSEDVSDAYFRPTRSNRNYYRQLARHFNFHHCGCLISTRLKNGGRTAIRNARVVISSRIGYLNLIHPLDEPQVPSTDHLAEMISGIGPPEQRHPLRVDCDRVVMRATREMGVILAGETVSVEEFCFLEILSSGLHTLSVSVLAENLSKPICTNIDIKSTVEEIVSCGHEAIAQSDQYGILTTFLLPSGE